MNAPVNVQQELMPVPASMREIDRKRYLWMISPALPVIGLGILAGYHFGPRPLKKVFALGGPLLLHVVIPAIDTIIGKDARNPTDEPYRVCRRLFYLS
ncbi:alkane 1-monooxygenase domain protein [Acinetobacter baumannii 1440422]|nr:alkane 1-monooxygenase domain protein [Acinetobacter baumannii 1440422]